MINYRKGFARLGAVGMTIWIIFAVVVEWPDYTKMLTMIVAGPVVTFVAYLDVLFVLLLGGIILVSFLGVGNWIVNGFREK